jgi:predicted O-methyltransferase YrrM
MRGGKMNESDARFNEYKTDIAPEIQARLRCFDAPERESLWRYMKSHTEQQGKVKSYCELGTCCGVSMWMIAPFVEDGGTLIGVDLFNGKSGQPESSASVMKALRVQGYQAHMIAGKTLRLRDKVAEVAPFDMLLIDADHSYEASLADFDAYYPLVAKGGLIMMHDIYAKSFGVWKTWMQRKHLLADVCEFGRKQGIGIGVKL